MSQKIELFYRDHLFDIDEIRVQWRQTHELWTGFLLREYLDNKKQYKIDKIKFAKKRGVNWHPARIVGRVSIQVSSKKLDYLWQPFFNTFDKQGVWVGSKKIACFGSAKTNHPLKATPLFHWFILVGVTFAVANPFQMFKQFQLSFMIFPPLLTPSRISRKKQFSPDSRLYFWEVKTLLVLVSNFENEK